MGWRSLRVKIVAVVVATMIPVGILGVVTYATLARQLEAGRRVRESLQAIALAREVDNYPVEAQGGIEGAVLFGQADALRRAERIYATFVSRLKELERLVATRPDQLARVRRLGARTRAWHDGPVARTAEATGTGPRDRAVALAAQSRQDMEGLRHEFGEFLRAEERILSARRLAREAAQRRTTLVLIAGGLIVLAGGAVASLVLGSHAVRPLAALTQAVERAARGDLRQQVAVARGDEVGRLGAAFNQMVTEVTHREETVERARREAETFLEVQRDLTETLDLVPLLGKIARHARLLCRSDLAYIAPVDARAGAARILALVGERTPALRGLTIEPGRGLEGRVLETGRPHATASYADDPASKDADTKAALAEGIVASLAVPMVLNQEIIGLVSVANRRPRPFTEQDEAGLLRLALPAALAIRNVRLLTERAQERDLLGVRSRELARSEAQLRGIVQAASDAILTVAPDGTVTSANPAATAIFGYPAREIVGQDLHRLIPRPSDAPASAPLGVQATFSRHQVLEGLRRDGTRVPVELSVSVVRTERDHFFAMVVRDITERNQAEQALLRLAAIVESSDDAILGLGLDRTISSWNPAAERTFGYTTDDAVGRPISIVITEDETARIQERLDQGEPVNNYETVCTRKDGRTIDVSLTVSPIRNAAGRITGLSAIARDVSERKAIERLKDEFLATVSHELRTPLTAIKGHIELVLDGDAGPVTETQQRFLAIASQNTDRLGALISDLLDVERIEAGKIAMRREPVDVAAALRDVVATFRLGAERKGLAFRDEIPPLPRVVGDRDRLIQVFSNLVSNAIKYTSRGEIGVRATGTDGQVEVVVHDTGIGMSADEQRQLFSKFFRSQAPLVRAAGGTGLGLVIAKGIVERHGGSIRVESGTNAGSRFRVLLPASPEAAGASPVAAAS